MRIDRACMPCLNRIDWVKLSHIASCCVLSRAYNSPISMFGIISLVVGYCCCCCLYAMTCYYVPISLFSLDFHIYRYLLWVCGLIGRELSWQRWIFLDAHTHHHNHRHAFHFVVFQPFFIPYVAVRTFVNIVVVVAVILFLFSFRNFAKHKSCCSTKT